MTLPIFGGPWTEDKLRILRAYLDAYTTALKHQPFSLVYVDGFAGAGSYVESGKDYDEFHEFRRGSAQIALEIDDKPFDRLVFVERGTRAASALRQLSAEHKGRQIEVIEGDANVEVPEFCRNMRNFDRAVVFLDPYATQVSWSTVEAIAASQKIDCWILFPIMAVTRMMPRYKEPDDTTAMQLDRIFGGRQHWCESYRDSPQLSFLDDDLQLRERLKGSDRIAESYKRRLEAVFDKVAPTRRTLANSMNVPIFELFFAAGNPTGARAAIRIADHIILKNW